MGYARRTIDYQLDDVMSYEAAVAIDGPKGVGKTATATQCVVHTEGLSAISVNLTAVDFYDIAGLRDQHPAW